MHRYTAQYERKFTFAAAIQRVYRKVSKIFDLSIILILQLCRGFEMLNGLLTRLLVSGAAFLYPGYASFKVLSQAPVPQADLERLLMYWSVLGCIGGIEYAAEWIVSWIPFYYSIKIIFLLYLLLPQTQGTVYVYKSHLEPFLRSHEAEIDAWFSQYKAFAYKVLLNHFNTIWSLISASLGQSTPSTAPSDASAGASGTPPLQTVVFTAFNVLGGLCKMYGPTVLAVGSAVGKQLAKSAKATVVSIAAQADAALAASKEDVAKDPQNKKDVQSEIGIVPVLDAPTVAGGAPEVNPAPTSAPAPEPAPEPHEAPTPAAEEHIPAVPHVQPIYATVPEQMPPQAHQAFAPMPYPNFAILSQMLADPNIVADQQQDHAQGHPMMMAYQQMPFFAPHFAGGVGSAPSFIPTAHITPESAGTSAAETPADDAAPVSSTEEAHVTIQPTEATASESSSAATAGPAVHLEAVKDASPPPPPPPTAAVPASSLGSEAPPHSASAHMQPVLMPVPLLWVPPAMS